MKKFLTIAVVCLSLATMSLEADAARRFGGGMSFGRSAPTFVQKAPMGSGFTAPKAATQAPKAAARPGAATNAAGAAARPSMMKSILGGLAAGLGISALLSMLGLGGAGLANFITGLLLALVVFYVVRLIFARRSAAAGNAGRSSMNPAAGAPQQEPEAPVFERRAEPVEPAAPSASAAGARPGSVMDQFTGGSAAQAAADDVAGGAADVTPADFDREAFLKVAAENYVKLQKAWASGNVIDISDFTSNDIFIALTHQLRERGNEKFDIEVQNLKNELFGIALEGDRYVAVVRFTSDIVVNGEKEPADELWILEKPVEGNEGWILSGIKQNESAPN